MNKLIFTTVILYFLFFFIFFGCKSEPSQDHVLHQAKDIIKTAKGIQYHFQSNWDTRLNQSKTSFSVDIKYSKLKDSHHGFGFYAKEKTYEFLYDGINYKEIDHEEKMIVNYNSDEIKADSTYFLGLMVLSDSPLDLLDTEEFESVNDTIIGQENYYVYKEVNEKKSVSDSSKIVRNEKYYFIEQKTKLLSQIKSIVLIENDTAQIIDNYFSKIKLDNNPFPLIDISSIENLRYKEINSEDLENENFLKQIKAGNQLNQKTYRGLNNKEVALYGDEKKQSVIMFSFIGCGGCEIALRKMKEKSFQIKDNINFYYSSPQNTTAPLKSYLAKKEFPFQAFSKESNMNNEFSIFYFPTFAMIDSKGVVTDVIQGYDEAFMETIFK